MLMTAITDGHTASDTITSIQKRLIAAQLHSSASVQ
jgi:hypothetical protein